MDYAQTVFNSINQLGKHNLDYDLFCVVETPLSQIIASRL